MPRLECIDPTTDSGPGADILNGPLKAKQINIFKGLAAHPSVLEAFVAWAGGSKGGELSPAEVEVVQLATAQRYDCDYCLAAHTMVAAGTGLDDSDCEAIRRGDSENPRLQALVNFTNAVLDTTGNVSDQQLADFRSAGYSDQAVIEVVAGISVMTFTSFYNHIHDTEVDFPQAAAV